MKVIDKLQRFSIPDCGMCEESLGGKDPYKVIFVDGTVDYICDGCADAIQALLDINLDTCEKMII